MQIMNILLSHHSTSQQDLSIDLQSSSMDPVGSLDNSGREVVLQGNKIVDIIFSILKLPLSLREVPNLVALV